MGAGTRCTLGFLLLSRGLLETSALAPHAALLTKGNGRVSPMAPELAPRNELDTGLVHPGMRSAEALKGGRGPG